MGRLWLTLEAWFVFYYLWERHRLAAPAKSPPMRGDKLSVGRRCLRVTDDIYKGIQTARLRRPQSMDELNDGVDLEGHSLEGLLRLWDAQTPQSSRDLQVRDKQTLYVESLHAAEPHTYSSLQFSQSIPLQKAYSLTLLCHKPTPPHTAVLSPVAAGARSRAATGATGL